MVKISNNLLAILIIIFGLIVSYNNWLIYKNAELIAVTGQTTKTGTITIDFTKPAAPAEEAAAEEEVAAAAPSAAGGGGGGGLGAGFVPEKEISPSIKLDTDLIKVSLKEDQIITESLRITNDGNTKLELNLKISGVEEFIFLSEDSITLELGESKSIKLKIVGISIGAYSGKILIKGDGINESVRVIFDVESKKILFDIALDLIKSEILIGDDLNIKIGLINLGVPGMVNVSLYYKISDSNNNIVLKENEIVKVETQKEFIKNFKLPSDIAIGDYLISAEVRYGEDTAISSSLFKVIKSQIILKFSLIGVLTILVVLLIVLTIINLREHKDLKYIIKTNKILKSIGLEISPREMKRISIKRGKIQKKLDSLLEAYNSGFISKESYGKSKKSLENEIKSLSKEKIRKKEKIAGKKSIFSRLFEKRKGPKI